MADGNLCLVAIRVLELLCCEEIVRSYPNNDYLRALKESISGVSPLLFDAEENFLPLYENMSGRNPRLYSQTVYVEILKEIWSCVVVLSRALYDIEDCLETIKMKLPGLPRIRRSDEGTHRQWRSWKNKAHNFFLFHCSSDPTRRNTDLVRKEMEKPDTCAPQLPYIMEQIEKQVSSLRQLDIEELIGKKIQVPSGYRKDAIVDILLRTHDPAFIMDENVMVVRSAFYDDKVQTHFDLRVWVDFTTGYSSTSPVLVTFHKILACSTIRKSPIHADAETLQDLVRYSVHNKRCLIVLEGLTHYHHDQMSSAMRSIQIGALDSKICLLYVQRTDGKLLMNSYDNLPSPLKHCFAYCSLFPDDHEIDVQSLIRLWMAQGFITMGDDMEDIGYDYFIYLRERSYFYETKKDWRGRAKKCKIPYPVYKMATQKSRNLCIVGTSNQSFDINNVPLHISLDSNQNLQPVDEISSKWRSLLFFMRNGHHLDNVFLNSILKNCNHLRALDIHAGGIKIVPHLIGELKHLRYLDLSHNKDITELPDSITKLRNLQTLNLSSCSSLKVFPLQMGNMVNLRHLQTDGCFNLTGNPQGLGRLTNLCTLSQVVLNEDDHKARAELDEVSKLSNLREVKIKNLRHEMGEHNASCLYSLRRVQSLSLEWKSGAHEVKDPSLIVDRFPDLEELTLDGFRDATAMFSFKSIPQNLSKVVLRRLATCRALPKFKDHCQLRVLVLDEIMDLEYVWWEQFSDDQICQSLQELWLTELPNLRGWCEESSFIQTHLSFQRLSRLVIEDCPKLISMPLFPTLEEGLVLDSTSWELFRKTMSSNFLFDEHKASTSTNNLSGQYSWGPLSKLKNLCIISIKGFDNLIAEEIAWETLKSLKMLKFDYLPEMMNLPERLQKATSLRELHIWRCNIKEFPEAIEKLELLESIVIRACPNFKSLPKSIQSLKKLQTLEIQECPTLLWRCRKETGADWEKIAHIKNLRLGRVSAR